MTQLKHVHSYSEFVNEARESEPHFHFPSKKFSLKTGINVFTEWKLPRDRESLNKKMSKLFPDNEDNIETVEKLWRDTVLINPEIEKWITDKGKETPIVQKWDILFGMISMFNEDDIRSWQVSTGIDKPRSWSKRIDKIEKESGGEICWVPSDKTLAYIESELKANKQ